MNAKPTIATDITQIHAATSFLFQPENPSEAIAIDPWAKQSFIDVVTLLTNQNRFLLPVPQDNHGQQAPSLISACAEVSEPPVSAVKLTQHDQQQLLKETVIDLQSRVDPSELCSWLNFQFSSHVWPQYMRAAGEKPVHDAREVLALVEHNPTFLSFMNKRVRDGKLRVPIEIFHWTKSAEESELTLQCLAYATSVAYRGYPYMAALSQNDAECVYYPHVIRTFGPNILNASSVEKTYSIFPWGSILASYKGQIRERVCNQASVPTEDGIKHFGDLCRTLREDEFTFQAATALGDRALTYENRRDLATEAAEKLFASSGTIPELRESTRKQAECLQSILTCLTLGIQTLQISGVMGELPRSSTIVVWGCELASKIAPRIQFRLDAKMRRGKLWDIYDDSPYREVIAPSQPS